jgi:hypothetical protein
MFETEIEAGLKGIKVKAEADGGIITRVCTLTITREFDSTIANALGGAKKIHAALNAGDVTSCVLPIDRILCAIQLVADGDRLNIDKAHGTKATAKAGDPDSDTPPRIDLEFEFVFSQEAWAFLGRHVGAMARLRLNRSQQELPLGERAEA